MRPKRYILTLLIVTLLSIIGYTAYINIPKDQVQLTLYQEKYDSSFKKKTFYIRKSSYESDTAAALNEIFNETGIIVSKVKIVKENQCIKVDIAGREMERIDFERRTSSADKLFSSNQGIDRNQTLIVTLLNLPGINKVILTNDGSFKGIYNQEGERDYITQRDHDIEILEKNDLHMPANHMKLSFYLVSSDDFNRTIEKRTIAVQKTRYENDKAAVLNEIFKEVGLTIRHIEIATAEKRIIAEVVPLESNVSLKEGVKTDLLNTLVITLLNLPGIDKAVVTGENSLRGVYVQDGEFKSESSGEPEVIKVRDINIASNQIKIAAYRFNDDLGEKVMVAVDKEMYEKNIVAVLKQLFINQPGIKIRNAVMDRRNKRITVDIDGTRIDTTFNAGSTAGKELSNALIITMLNLPGINQAIITVDGKKGCWGDHYSFDGIFVRVSETVHKLVNFQSRS
ncbi:MAG TPA: hypothetical protein PKK43_00730 [Spirochaetota bacterium]|nr:hypothetical protein [Spirochaetota bacterium]